MSRSTLGWVGAFAVATVVALVAVPPGQPGTNAVDHRPLPDLTISDIDGVPLDTSTWRGRVTIVNFWATWCAPCQVEVPEFIELQRDHPNRVQIIGLSLDDSADAVREFAAEMGINYPLAIVDPTVGDLFGGVLALPTSFVIDPEGHIVARHVGLVSMDVYRDAVDTLVSTDGA